MTMLTYQGEKYTKPYPAWQAQTNLGTHTLSMWDGQTKIALTYETTGTVIGEYNGDYLLRCSEGVFFVAPRFLDRIGGVLHRLHFDCPKVFRRGTSLPYNLVKSCFSTISKGGALV